MVYWRGSGPIAGISRKDCMIENISFDQDQSNGVVGEVYAYQVSIDLSQIRLGQAATLTRETLPVLKDSKAAKKDSNATTVKTDTTGSAAGNSGETTPLVVPKRVAAEAQRAVNGGKTK